MHGTPLARLSPTLPLTRPRHTTPPALLDPPPALPTSLGTFRTAQPHLNNARPPPSTSNNAATALPRALRAPFAAGSVSDHPPPGQCTCASFEGRAGCISRSPTPPAAPTVLIRVAHATPPAARPRFSANAARAHPAAFRTAQPHLNDARPPSSRLHEHRRRCSSTPRRRFRRLVAQQRRDGRLALRAPTNRPRRLCELQCSRRRRSLLPNPADTQERRDGACAASARAVLRFSPLRHPKTPTRRLRELRRSRGHPSLSPPPPQPEPNAMTPALTPTTGAHARAVSPFRELAHSPERTQLVRCHDRELCSSCGAQRGLHVMSPAIRACTSCREPCASRYARAGLFDATTTRGASGTHHEGRTGFSRHNPHPSSASTLPQVQTFTRAPFSTPGPFRMQYRSRGSYSPPPRLSRIRDCRCRVPMSSPSLPNKMLARVPLHVRIPRTQQHRDGTCACFEACAGTVSAIRIAPPLLIPTPPLFHPISAHPGPNEAFTVPAQARVSHCVRSVHRFVRPAPAKHEMGPIKRAFRTVATPAGSR
ncbi:hypothetical protein HYPSUDRAFT_207574 [Hypholoma sublateritium FD-334 SS-4]|uniref:Uncharacterized protein n=1 Tax=Hypholoma sublateritium (strain FD-334 SS-4) TaxID=945553 RepID=A0A0D2P5T9_HYPSF|nr:hypothetical protein HYPSUDRAFT_207574 [Hypholoma sublateritium FD-334 SS-4]